MVGPVGTPTANAMMPLLTAARMPMIGAFTGARTLRTPYQPYALNVRASYDDELASLVSYALLKGLTRFSIFYQVRERETTRHVQGAVEGPRGH